MPPASRLAPKLPTEFFLNGECRVKDTGAIQARQPHRTSAAFCKAGPVVRIFLKATARTERYC